MKITILNGSPKGELSVSIQRTRKLLQAALLALILEKNLRDGYDAGCD